MITHQNTSAFSFMIFFDVGKIDKMEIVHSVKIMIYLLFLGGGRIVYSFTGYKKQEYNYAYQTKNCSIDKHGCMPFFIP
jgi:hypothetical protein